MSGVGGPVAGTSSAEDVGDLVVGAQSASAVGRRLYRGEHAEPVERADDVLYRARRHPGIERGGLKLGVAEQRLDDPDVDAVL